VLMIFSSVFLIERSVANTVSSSGDLSHIWYRSEIK
jgi:hypothetical protein